MYPDFFKLRDTSSFPSREQIRNRVVYYFLDLGDGKIPIAYLTIYTLYAYI